jgi:Na+/phosphate symporter
MDLEEIKEIFTQLHKHFLMLNQIDNANKILDLEDEMNKLPNMIKDLKNIIIQRHFSSETELKEISKNKLATIFKICNNCLLIINSISDSPQKLLKLAEKIANVTKDVEKLLIE